MSRLKRKLAQLEARLQGLVEGGAKRAFGGEPADLSASLLAAMNAGRKRDASGKWMAPNLYILEVHPALAESLREDPGILDELAATLVAAGTDGGLAFLSPPNIRIHANSDLVYSQVNVMADFQPVNIDETNTVAVASGEGGAVPGTAFLIMEGRRIFPLNAGVINIGRRADNHLVVEDKRVSRQHAQLRAVQGQYVLFDLDSTGGTFVNGERIRQRPLRAGDVVSLAGVNLVYGQESDESGSTQAATQPIDSSP